MSMKNTTAVNLCFNAGHNTQHPCPDQAKDRVNMWVWNWTTKVNTLSQGTGSYSGLVRLVYQHQYQDVVQNSCW